MFVEMHVPFEKFHREKKVIIYLPEDYYKTKKRYPVMYINDGQNAFFDHASFMGTSWGFDQYVKKAQLDVIMVAIPCVFDDQGRMNEYGPWPLTQKWASLFHATKLGGQGDDYVHFLIDHLKVLIDHRFRTLPNHTSIVGSSMGGVISAYAYFRYPHIFNKAAALSTAFFLYEEEFLALIDEAPHIGKGLYFDLGDDEGHGNNEESAAYLSSNARIKEALDHHLMPYEYHFFEHTTHNEAAWRQRLPLFMPYLLEGDGYV